MTKEITLPEGWEMKKLQDVCLLITCGVAKKPAYTEDGIPFLSARNVKNGSIVWNNYKYISQDFHNELTKKNKPLLGDILYTRVGSYGEASVIEKDIEFSIFVSLTLIKTKDFLDSYFLKYYLNSNKVKKIAKESISGSGVGNLNVGTVRKFDIPIPPLQEQKRIVKILDEVFGELEEAKKNAEENLRNAKELFESYLHNVFEEKGEDWEERKLGEVCEKMFAGGDVPKDNFSKYETEKYNIPIYANAVKLNGLYGYTNITRVEKESITIAARGSGTGHITIRRDNYYPIVRLIVIIPDDNILDLDFLKYGLKTLTIIKSGSAIPQLTIPMIKKYIISFPKDINKQKEIVRVLDELSGEVEEMEGVYGEKIEKIDELRRSVLERAFGGEL